MTRRVEMDLSGAQSYALKMANQGHDAIFIARHLFSDPVVVACLTAKGKSKAEALAQRIADWAVEQVRLHPVEAWRAEVPARIAAIRERVNAAPVSGPRTAPTDSRVAEVFYATAVAARSTVYKLSIRTGGVRGGMSETTFCAAIGRLRRVGVVTRLAGSQPGGRVPARYRIGTPHQTCTGRTGGVDLSAQVHEFPPPPVNRLVEMSWALVLQHDAFRPAALGDLGWMLTHRLHPETAIDVADLASLTGIGIARLRRSLDQLRSLEIASRDVDGWTFAPADVDELLTKLDAIAADLGTAGALQAERERHAGHRAEFDDDLLSAQVPDADRALALVLDEADREAIRV